MRIHIFRKCNAADKGTLALVIKERPKDCAKLRYPSRERFKITTAAQRGLALAHISPLGLRTNSRPTVRKGKRIAMNPFSD